MSHAPSSDWAPAREISNVTPCQQEKFLKKTKKHKAENWVLQQELLVISTGLLREQCHQSKHRVKERPPSPYFPPHERHWQQSVQICRDERWGISVEEGKNNTIVTAWKRRGSSKLCLE